MEIDIYNYDAIIKVLKDNNYINLMKLESRLQPVIGFVAILTKYLQILIRRKEKQGRNHKGEDKLESEKYLSNLKKTMSVYLEQF